MATISAEALKRVQDQAAKQGISMNTVSQVAQQKGITNPVISPKITVPKVSAPIDQNV